MSENDLMQARVCRDQLPSKFPTHRHSAEFWEQLGRSIATFGFLEEVLGKAIFALTATREYPVEELDAAFDAWIATLRRALTDQLCKLADSFGKAARGHPDVRSEGIDALVADIKAAAAMRNVLCHGSWRPPDANGASMPLFINRKYEAFSETVDAAYLVNVRRHTVDLICSVIDTVTHMGIQFPGGAGPGRPIG